MAKEYKAASLQITLKKSLIGCKKDQIATAASLGLKKIGQTVTQRPMNRQLVRSIRFHTLSK